MKEEISYNDLPQLELIERASKNNDYEAYHYLIEKYMYIVEHLIRKNNYFLPGAEPSDLIQEGRIGLYRAIKDFNPEKQMKFENFATMCVRRCLITAVKAHTRNKCKPLNEGTSLDRPTKENETYTMMDVLSDNNSLDPMDTIILSETRKIIKAELDKVLSEREKDVIELFLQDHSYTEIMRLYNKKNNQSYTSEKIVDNAMQRAKKKYSHIMKELERDENDE